MVCVYIYIYRLSFQITWAPTQDDIVDHLSAFALGHLADVAVTELTRGQKVLLTFAKAFWPRPPHVLFVPLGVVGKVWKWRRERERSRLEHSKGVVSKEKNHFNIVTEEKIELKWYLAQIASWIFEQKVMVCCFQNLELLDVMSTSQVWALRLGVGRFGFGCGHGSLTQLVGWLVGGHRKSHAEWHLGTMDFSSVRAGLTESSWTWWWCTGEGICCWGSLLKSWKCKEVKGEEPKPSLRKMEMLWEFEF